MQCIIAWELFQKATFIQNSYILLMLKKTQWSFCSKEFILLFYLKKKILCLHMSHFKFYFIHDWFHPKIRKIVYSIVPCVTEWEIWIFVIKEKKSEHFFFYSYFYFKPITKIKQGIKLKNYFKYINGQTNTILYTINTIYFWTINTINFGKWNKYYSFEEKVINCAENIDKWDILIKTFSNLFSFPQQKMFLSHIFSICLILSSMFLFILFAVYFGFQLRVK